MSTDDEYHSVQGFFLVSNSMHDPKDDVYLSAIQKMREDARLIRKQKFGETPEQKIFRLKTQFYRALYWTIEGTKSLLDWAFGVTILYGGLGLLLKIVQVVSRIHFVRWPFEFLDSVYDRHGFAAGALVVAAYLLALFFIAPLISKLCISLWVGVLKRIPDRICGVDTIIAVPVALALMVGSLLLLAIPSHWPYRFYVILRWVVFASGIGYALGCYEMEKPAWARIMASLAIIYNPLLPFHFARSQWQIINLLAALAFVVLVWKFRQAQSDEREILGSR
jgi:hypothetical protein